MQTMTSQLFLLVGLTVDYVSAAAIRPQSLLNATDGTAAVSPLVAAQSGTAPVSALVAAKAAECIYYAADESRYTSVSSCTDMNAEGWTLAHNYEVITTYHLSGATLDDRDDGDLYTKGDDCLFVTMGIGDVEQAILANSDYIQQIYGGFVREYHGAQVFSGAAYELEKILGKMEAVHGSVSAAFSACATLTLAGHSFGATQLELIQYLATLPGDPRGIGMQPVHGYAFLPTPVFYGASPTNPAAADGCYPTTAYYTSVPASVSGLSGEVVDMNLIALYPALFPKQPFTQIIADSPPSVGASTACGEVPAAFGAMAADATLLSHGAAWYIGPPYYLHAMSHMIGALSA